MMKRIKVLGGVAGFILCFIALGWFVVENLSFRQELRTSLNQAYSQLSNDEINGGPEKTLNWYYESLYSRLPNPIVPGLFLSAGLSILFISRRSRR